MKSLADVERSVRGERSAEGQVSGAAGAPVAPDGGHE